MNAGLSRGFQDLVGPTRQTRLLTRTLGQCHRNIRKTCFYLTLPFVFFLFETHGYNLYSKYICKPRRKLAYTDTWLKRAKSNINAKTISHLNETCLDTSVSSGTLSSGVKNFKKAKQNNIWNINYMFILLPPPKLDPWLDLCCAVLGRMTQSLLHHHFWVPTATSGARLNQLTSSTTL